MSGTASLVYSTYLGGNDDDFGGGDVESDGRGIAVDGAGNAYVMGTTYSFNFPTRNQYQPIHAGGFSDAFVTKLNTNLSGDVSLLYSTYLGGSGRDLGLGMAVDGSGNAYVTGTTRSVDFPTRNAYQSANAGGFGDAYRGDVIHERQRNYHAAV